MPANTVYVGRPTKWGNPFTVGSYNAVLGRNLSQADAVARYRVNMADSRSLNLSLIRGKNLACWCPLDRPCHADVLLEIANGGEA